MKKGRLPKPLHIPRPHETTTTRDSRRPPDKRPQRRHATTPAEVMAVLQRGFGPRRG